MSRPETATPIAETQAVDAQAQGTVRNIEESPTVVSSRAELVRVRQEHFMKHEGYAEAIRKRDQQHVAERVTLQSQLLSAQKEVAELQSRMLAIRAAAYQ
jgi:hypothetical protein